MKLITLLSNYIYYNVDELKLKLAIRLADKTHARTGKRYFVMPDDKDKLIIMHRPSFRSLKHTGRMSYSAKIVDLKRESFYFTPYTFQCQEKEAITPTTMEAKRIMFHQYMKESRITRKKEFRLPLLTRLRIRLKLLVIQYKMAVR